MAHDKRRRPKFRKRKKNRLGRWTTVGIVALILAYLGVIELSQPHVTGDELRFDSFVDLAERGRMDDAQILDFDAFMVGGYVRDDGTSASYNTPYLKDSSNRERLIDVLLENNIPTTINQQNGKRAVSLGSILLPSLILILLFVYLILSHRQGSGLFAVRSGARKIAAGTEGATFADVAGQQEAVTELREIKDFLSDPERYAALGAVVPKGILLFGPPGCGKTLLARALAGEAGANFYSISGSDFVEVYVGVGAARVRELFSQARENAPAIVFIDELDSIGRARGLVGTAQSQGEQEQGLNQILTEMDGFSTSDGIIVVGATNRPDVLDQALLRPGRFDRAIGLERPDESARLAILSLHGAGKPLDPSADLAAIARRAIGLTGADLANLMNEGALLSARAGRASISQVELDRALERILEAPERQRRLSMRERSIGKRFASDERMTFADVAGVDDAVEELTEIKEYLASPERFVEMGARAPRGVLLTGPPGCGKTLLARAVAGEANAAFFSVAGSEFVEVFAGEGASRVRDLFAEAKAVAPAIVFIDEIDTIGSHRGGTWFAGHRESDQTLNQILVELDGFEARSGVILMAATNRVDMLDPALVRAGRIDRKIEIAPPDRSGRRAILQLHTRAKPLADDVDLDALAGLTRGFTGADLANVMNEAALLATRRGLPHLTRAVLEEGADRGTFGLGSRTHVMSEEERQVIAHHEAGHAVVAFLLPDNVVPHKLTILPRGNALGHATLLDSHDRAVMSRSRLLDQMVVLLGGKVAEEVVFGESGSAPSADLHRVGIIARQMVRELGMSDALGPVAYPELVGADGRPQASCSEASAQAIDLEVRRLVDEAAGRARELMLGSRHLLDQVAEALLDQETLSAPEFEKIVGTSPGSSK